MMVMNQSTPSKKSTESARSGAKRRVRILLFTVLCFAIWAGVTLVGQFGRMSDNAKQLNKLEGELAKAQKVNAQYKQDVKRLNDKEYIEQIDRKLYHMTKDGETLYILTE